jgi:hypothetical protein
MSTSRVPGVTRNSGWRFVDATIVAARTRDPRLSEISTAQAEEAVRERGESRRPGSGSSSRVAPDA